MLGLILNVDDDLLVEDSPSRTHEEDRAQPSVFTLEDGFPVFEVWFWRLGAWWCWSRAYNPLLAAQGVRFFDSIEQLKGLVAEQAAPDGD